jgi:hypothetical protein
LITRIELEMTPDVGVDDDSRSVSGSLRVDGGATTAFVGWVQLLSILEQSMVPESHEGESL